MQGNIIALIDNSGTTVVQYNYDAWGNHKVVDANGNEITDSTHIGNLNPFRYRGYYYDTETGLLARIEVLGTIQLRDILFI